VTTFELELVDLAHRGDAVGFHEGKAIFVPLGIPGETVRVQIVDQRRRYARARLLEVIRPAPERVSPPCPHFGTCGGCHWQHISYEAQLRFKRNILVSQLERIGRQVRPVVHPFMGMKDPWAYRNQVQLSVDAQGRLGYQARGSHEVVPVDSCRIAHPLLNELWPRLDLDPRAVRRISLRAGIATGERMLILEGDDAMAPHVRVDLPISCLYRRSREEMMVLAGSGHIHERVAGRTFRVSGDSFFQVNTSQANRLVCVVRDYLSLQGNEVLLDAYCGVGTLGLSLAALARCVVGVEESPRAFQDAMANTSEEDDAEFLLGKVAGVVPHLQAPCDAIVLDPPRAGCEPAAVPALAGCGASRLVYVSCETATLARDIARLASLGYRLEQVQPIDMFPQTYHVEAVALLRRQD